MTTARQIRLLLIEDSEADAHLAVAELEDHGFDVRFTRVDGRAVLAKTLESHPWDLVLCDHGLPGFASREALALVQRKRPDVPFVLLSGMIGEEAAVEALKAGARDVVLKTNLSRLGTIVDRELREAAGRRLQRETELARAASEARNAAILESALDAVITTDDQGRVVDFNPAAERTFGYTAAEAAGRGLAELVIPPSLRALHQDDFARHLATGEGGMLGRRTELTAVRKDGSEFPVELSISRGELDGRPFFTGFVRDLTEQREAEFERTRLHAELLQAQKMEAIGRLAAGVAHDFNNLMTVIQGFSTSLERRVGDDPKSQADLDHIKGAALRAGELTRQLLAFSRQQVLHPQVTDLNAVVAETLDLLQRVIGEDIEIVYRPEPELRSTVVDRNQLSQVILNLVVNAREAMPSGGILTIQTSNEDLETQASADQTDIRPGPYAVLRISDSGTGMDADTRKRVFDPFFTTKRTGTGLGLSTAYGIVSQSEGHIRVDSEPEAGSTFTIHLPTVDAQPVDTERTPTATESTGVGTILVVEDEHSLRAFVVGELEYNGYTVLEAANASDALELAEQYQDSIDLLLTDVVMPGLSGAELAQRLRALRPTLKVLFTSGYPPDVELRNGVAERRAAFIGKPYWPEELARTVRDTLHDKP